MKKIKEMFGKNESSGNFASRLRAMKSELKTSYEIADNKFDGIVEFLAREVMNQNDSVVEFSAGMGVWSFMDSKGEVVEDLEGKAFDELESFLGDWVDRFGLSMRIEKGKKRDPEW